MKVLVCGGRDFWDHRYIFAELDRFRAQIGITALVHGAARGVDQLAGMWAQHRGIAVIPYPADWRLYGLSAGPKRNARMLSREQPGAVLAFPGGSGTCDMVRRATRAAVPVLGYPGGGLPPIRVGINYYVPGWG